MQRTPAVLAGVLAMLLAPAWSAAQGITVDVWPLPSGVTIADTVEVQLRVLNGASPFNAFEAVLHYDPAVLRYVPRPRGQEEGSSMRGACGSTFWQESVAGDSIELDNSLLCNQRSLVGRDTLLDLQFVVVGPGPVTWIRFSHLLVYEDGVFVLPATGVDAPVWIVTTLDAGPPDVAGPLRLTAFPNPARGAVELVVERAGEGPGALSVLDLAGRTVRRFATAGGAARRVTWDGRCDDGRLAPPGVYCALYRGAERHAVTRFVRIR